LVRRAFRLLQGHLEDDPVEVCAEQLSVFHDQYTVWMNITVAVP
jgi:hypothetical protein